MRISKPKKSIKQAIKGVKKMSQKARDEKRVFKQGLAKVGEVYYYRFSKNGKIHQGSTGCQKLSEAKNKIALMKAEKSREASGVKEIPTFSEAVSLWYNSRLGKRSDVYLKNAKRQMEIHVFPSLGNYKCNLITAEMIEMVLNKYLHSNNLQFVNKAHNLGGYNTHAAWISSVLKHLVPSYMPSAPKIRIEKQQKVKKPFIPKEKIDDFLAEIDKCKNLHVKVAVRAMLYMGLRESEALQMKYSNLNVLEKTYCPDKTKGKEAVSLPVPLQMLAWFDKVTPIKDCEWILPADDLKPHRKHFTTTAVERAGVAIGVKLSPHRLRGTFATLLAKQGHSAFIIKDMLRHKDIQTSLSYIEIGLEDMQRASEDLWK